jgi:hypothetical protein
LKRKLASVTSMARIACLVALACAVPACVGGPGLEPPDQRSEITDGPGQNAGTGAAGELGGQDGLKDASAPPQQTDGDDDAGTEQDATTTAR